LPLWLLDKDALLPKAEKRTRGTSVSKGSLNNKETENKGVKEIAIFLACSSELEEERSEFERFINRENKVLIKQGVFLDLEIWEDFIDSMSPTRLQDEYNKAVRASDIFVSLFFTKAGKYTVEEFDAAYGQFIKSGKPSVYVYVKDAPINTGAIKPEDMISLLNLKEKLKKLEHYPTEYKSIGDLKFHFKKQLEKQFPKYIHTPT
jgi:hypothetical protein